MKVFDFDFRIKSKHFFSKTTFLDSTHKCFDHFHPVRYDAIVREK